MELQTAINQLHQDLLSNSWYSGKVVANPDLHNSIVAYVSQMGTEVFNKIPDKIGDWDVRVHFISSELASPEAFKVPATNFVVVKESSVISKEVAEESETDLFDLREEIWYLSKKCGWDTLENILFEIHDGTDAITEDSLEFPEVRTALDEIYQMVGFDVLADQII